MNQERQCVKLQKKKKKKKRKTMRFQAEYDLIYQYDQEDQTVLTKKREKTTILQALS